MPYNSRKLGYDILGEPSPVPSTALCPAEKLQWKLSEKTTNDIQIAKRNLDRLVEDVDHQVITFEDFGKDVPKTFKLSPDGFIQMAVQLAYYSLYNRQTAAREMAITRWFLLGRVDYIRTFTNAAHTFVKTMVDPVATAKEKVKAMVAAVKAHSDYAVDAMNGQAVDTHLLGLKLMAQEAGMEFPDMKYEAYSSSHFCIGSSQIPITDYDMFISSRLPAIPDGYGVYYIPQDHRVTFTVSSLRRCPDTDSLLFGTKLIEGMREMQALLVTTMAKL